MLKKFIIISINCYFLLTSTYAGNWDFGFKLGYVEPDESIVQSSDNADNAGIVLGYNWTKNYGTIGVEADYSTSFLDGSVNEAGVPIDEAFFIDTLGIHATYKTSRDVTNLGVYAKLKIGSTYYKLTDMNSLTEEEIEFSFGGGLGMNLGHVTLELNYVMIKDFNMLSFAVLF